MARPLTCRVPQHSRKELTCKVRRPPVKLIKKVSIELTLQIILVSLDRLLDQPTCRNPTIHDGCHVVADSAFSVGCCNQFALPRAFSKSISGSASSGFSVASLIRSAGVNPYLLAIAVHVLMAAETL